MQNLETEVLIYDKTIDKAYCLNETSMTVFNACNGATTFEDLKLKHRFTDDLIFLALDELKEKNLLDSAADYKTPFSGISRREVIRKVGFATMIALPLITSIVAPTAIRAASGVVCIPAGSRFPGNINSAGYCPENCRAGGTVSFRQYRNGGGVCDPAGGFFGNLTASCGPGGNDVGRTSTIDLSVVSNNC